MIPGRIQIRRYESQVATLITNLDSLVDPESELRRWREWDLHVLVHEPLLERWRTAYATVRDNASKRGLHIYPAFRTQPTPSFQFEHYVSVSPHPTLWETNAERLTNVAALRLPGDPWIGLDMESYNGGEPTAATLTTKNFTVAQLRAAMQPFIDALRATNASVVLYPAGSTKDGEVSLPGEDLLYIAESVGRERMELWTEATYENSEQYRRSSKRDWRAVAADFLRLMGLLQSRFPGCVIRPGIYDVERVWAEPYLSDLLRSGPCAPWGFDWTRDDASDFGKPEYRTGITLSKLNGATHVWPMQPMRTRVLEEFDTGIAPHKQLAQWGAQNTTDMKPLPTAIPHFDGIQFAAPPPPANPGDRPLWVWTGLGGLKVFADAPAPFTMDGTLRLPTDLPNSCPLFGGVWDHAAFWQVAYDANVDVIGLYVRIKSPQPGQLRYHFREMMQAPPRGVDIRCQVGRNGTRWLFQAAAPGRPVTGRFDDLLPADTGFCSSLLIGAGQAVADFPMASGKNSFAYCPGILLVKTWSIYDWLLDDDELKNLRTDTWQRPGKPPFTREGSWPYGYGKGNL